MKHLLFFVILILGSKLSAQTKPINQGVYYFENTNSSLKRTDAVFYGISAVRSKENTNQPFFKLTSFSRGGEKLEEYKGYGLGNLTNNGASILLSTGEKFEFTGKIKMEAELTVGPL